MQLFGSRRKVPDVKSHWAAIGTFATDGSEGDPARSSSGETASKKRAAKWETVAACSTRTDAAAGGVDASERTASDSDGAKMCVSAPPTAQKKLRRNERTTFPLPLDDDDEAAVPKSSAETDGSSEDLYLISCAEMERSANSDVAAETV